MDTYRWQLVLKGAAVALGLGLLVRDLWGATGSADPGTHNFFLTAALFLCVGLVALSDRLIDEPGMRGIAQLGGAAGLVAIGLATYIG